MNEVCKPWWSEGQNEVCQPGSFPTDEQLRAVARRLFVRVDMIRAFDQDYVEAVSILRDVFNAGRSRGIYEAGSGCQG